MASCGHLLTAMPLGKPPSFLGKHSHVHNTQFQMSDPVWHSESALFAYQINKRPVNAHSTASDGVKMAARFMCVTS